ASPGADSISSGVPSRSMPSSWRISRSVARLVVSIAASALAASCGLLSITHPPAPAPLPGHHAHAVRHHVVQFPGDPQPLLGDRPPRLVDLRLRAALGLLAQ